jgi:hypothetical protein
MKSDLEQDPTRYELNHFKNKKHVNDKDVLLCLEE